MLTTETCTIWNNSGHQTIVSRKYSDSRQGRRRILRGLTLLGIMLGSLFLGVDDVSGQSVGLNNASPDASSILDLTADDRGLLIPRMTSIERLAISSPATGLLVYDTDLSDFYFYTGSVWQTPGGGSDGDWTNSGNYWTNTTDSFGIGVSVPGARLHVEDTGSFVIGGITSGITGVGLFGEATHTTGGTMGVEGVSRSSNGVGVFGHNDTVVGSTFGVVGQAASVDGTGVYGENTSLTGTTIGVHGSVLSPAGYAGYFDGGKSYFSDSVGIGTTSPSNFVHLVQPSTFYMKLESQAANPFGIILENPNRIWYLLHSPSSNDGLSFYDDTRGVDVMYFDGPTGYIGINTVSPSEVLHVNGNLKLDSAIYDMNDDPGTSGQVLTSTGTQVDWVDAASLSDGDWTNSGNYWTNTTDSFGIGTAAPGAPLHVISSGVYSIVGQNSGTTGRAVYGTNTASTGINYGVYGETYSVNGSAVYGDALATSGVSAGVYGRNNSSSGIAVYGTSIATSGTTYGVFGQVASPNGFAGYFTGGTSYFGDSVGIGTTNPNEILDVAGTIEMTGFKLTTSPANGYVLTSDASGVGTWADPTSAGNFIENQTSSAQSASFRINGTGEINGSDITQFDVASSYSGSGTAAIAGTVTAGTNDAGVRGTASSTSAGTHYGVYGQATGINASSTNMGLFGYATGGTINWGAYLLGEYSSTSASEDILVIDRNTSGTSASGIGAGLVFRVENTSSGISYAGRISGILTSPAASSSSALTFETQTGGGGLTEHMRLDADGDLGVGTTNPLRKLHASSSSDDFQLRLAHPSSSAYSYDMGRDISDGFLHFYGNQTGFTGYQFEGIDGTYLTIENDGDVGIGDDTPDGKLEVRQTGTSDIFNLYDNTTNVFTVEDGGNVGIGVTNPSDKLEVSGDVYIDGEMTVTGNDISFSAYNSASDSKSSGWIKAEFNVEKHDDGSDYNVSTDRFTAPSAGVYHFSASVSINSAPDATRIVVALYKNAGSELILQSGYTNTTGNWQSFGGSGNIKLNASDYVEVYVYMDQSATHYGASSMYTNFSGHRLY